MEILEKIGGRRCTGLDLDGIQTMALIDQQIDFKPAALPIVNQVRLYPPLDVSLVDFSDHPALENRATQRVEAKLIGLANTR